MCCERGERREARGEWAISRTSLHTLKCCDEARTSGAVPVCPRKRRGRSRWRFVPSSSSIFISFPRNGANNHIVHLLGGEALMSHNVPSERVMAMVLQAGDVWRVPSQFTIAPLAGTTNHGLCFTVTTDRAHLPSGGNIDAAIRGYRVSLNVFGADAVFFLPTEQWMEALPGANHDYIE
jgi:hypothetical protein